MNCWITNAGFWLENKRMICNKVSTQKSLYINQIKLCDGTDIYEALT